MQIVTEEATKLSAYRISVFRSVCINGKTGLLLKLELSSHDLCSVSHGNMSSLQVQDVPAAGVVAKFSKAFFSQVKGCE